jgi:hypothetical protein
MNYHNIYDSLGFFANALGVPFTQFVYLPLEEQKKLVQEMKDLFSQDPFSAPESPKIDLGSLIIKGKGTAPASIDAPALFAALKPLVLLAQMDTRREWR